MARHVLLKLKLDQAGGRRTRHAPRPHSPRTPIALAWLMPPTSVACRSSSPGRTSANNARRRAAGHVRRVGNAPQSLRSVLAAPCGVS